jgi:hypothetical protein
MQRGWQVANRLAVGRQTDRQEADRLAGGKKATSQEVDKLEEGGQVARRQTGFHEKDRLYGLLHFSNYCHRILPNNIVGSIFL